MTCNNKDAELPDRPTCLPLDRPGSPHATAPDPARPKNTYVREDQILLHLAAIAILLAGDGIPVRGGITAPAQTADLIDQLYATGTVLTYDPNTKTMRAADNAAATIGKRS